MTRTRHLSAILFLSHLDTLPMSSFHPSTSTSSFTNKSNGRPFLIRADSLPSPPPSRPQKLGPRPSFDATSVPSPQSDVEMPDSTNDILFLSTQAAIDVESSPTTSRQAARMNNEVKIRRKTTPPPPPKGWHSPNNPFIVRDDAPRRPVTKPKKPEKMTYVLFVLFYIHFPLFVANSR